MVSVKESNNLFKKIELLCFGLIALNLLWSLWYGSPFAISYSIACFLLFALMVIEGLRRVSTPIPAGILIGYFAFLLWMLLMLIAYEKFYPSASRAQFFFLNLDSYAMFFVMLFLFCIPSMLLSDIYKVRNDKIIKVIMAIIILSTAYYTFNAVSFDVNAIRSPQSMIDAGYGSILFGAPGYSHIYSFMLLIPYFFHKTITSKGKERMFYLVGLVMLLYMIAVSQLATAFILSLLGILIYTFFHAKSITKVMVAIIGAFLVFFVVDNNGYDLLMSLSSKVEGDWSIKLADMAKSLVGEQDSGMVSGRGELYKASFDSFLASPIIGKYRQNDGIIGGHATAIDVLGLTGIMGFVPFIISIICNGIRMKRGTNYSNTKPVIAAVMIQFIALVFTKNIITSQAIFFTFFALIPMLLKTEDKETGQE